MSQSSALDGSTAVEVYNRLISILAGAWETSTLAGLLHACEDGLERAYRDSLLARLVAVVARWGRASVLYRWLTTEPDPAVIVIDLRESRVVGPVLSALDRVAAGLRAAHGGSAATSAGTAVADSFRRRPVQLAASVLLVAVLTETAASVTFGRTTAVGLGLRFLLAALALGGTRIRLTASECRQTAAYRALATLLAPPDPPPQRDTNPEEDEH